MPTYVYECEMSGKCFEKSQKMTDEPLKTCPECGATVHRLIGNGGGIIFKGPGFYATDYGSGASSATRCGRERPCCGRDVPCESPPCDD